MERVYSGKGGRAMNEAIILTAINLFWGYVWFEVGRFIGRRERE